MRIDRGNADLSLYLATKLLQYRQSAMKQPVFRAPNYLILFVRNMEGLGLYCRLIRSMN